MYLFIKQCGIAAMFMASFIVATPGSAAAPGPHTMPLQSKQAISHVKPITEKAPSMISIASITPVSSNSTSILATPTATVDEKPSVPNGAKDETSTELVPNGTKNGATEGSNAELDTKIKGWIKALSAEPGFAAWKKSNYVTTPLGPGTHAWLITLQDGDKETGYMIVSYDPDGKIELTEYGPGPSPLFSLATLRESLSQRGLLSTIPDYRTTAIRYYFGPLEAFWLVQIANQPYYFDAKSGEALPDLTKLLPKQTQSLLDSSKNNPKPVDHAGKLASVVDKIADQTLTEPFDPLDDAGWIVENPTPIKDIAALTNQLRTDKKVTFTIKLYAQKALFPFAVRGTHHWLSGSSYFAVEQQGPRYVSFNLKKIGHFYASP